MKYLSFYCIVLLSCCVVLLDVPRSIHRPRDLLMPEIITFWTDEKKDDSIPEQHYILRSYHLAEWSIFGRYDKELLDLHRMPDTIHFRYEPAISIKKDVLEALIEDFVQELATATKKRAEFKNFIIFKDRNFNYKMNAGLIIVKFKDYPFVVKLFIENPKSFIKPFSKGFETIFFFVMSDGITRYIMGFTRIPNLISIQQKIDSDPYWKERLVLPRKWYWKPNNVRTIKVVGKNIGCVAEQSIEFPSTYAIICDEIQIERQLHTYRKQDRTLVKEIVQFLGNRIDPHVYNFFVEKGTGKTALIDTEHLASLVGLYEPMPFYNNTQWYCTLGLKCMTKACFNTKKNRREIQKRPLSENLKI